MEYIVFLHEAEIARGTVDDIIEKIDDLIVEKGYKKNKFIVYECEDDIVDYQYYFENSDELSFEDII